MKWLSWWSTRITSSTTVWHGLQALPSSLLCQGYTMDVRAPLTAQGRTAHILQAGLTTTNWNRNGCRLPDSQLANSDLTVWAQEKSPKLQKSYFHKKARIPAALEKSALVTLAKVSGGFPSKWAWAFQMVRPPNLSNLSNRLPLHLYLCTFVPCLCPQVIWIWNFMLALTTSPAPWPGQLNNTLQWTKLLEFTHKI